MYKPIREKGCHQPASIHKVVAVSIMVGLACMFWSLDPTKHMLLGQTMVPKIASESHSWR